MTWTPETNRIQLGLLTDEEKAALKACEHGWEICIGNALWENSHAPFLSANAVYRAKPAPKRIVSWHNVHRSGFGSAYTTRRAADFFAYSDRLCVYRITRNEDGSDPTIEVEDV